MCAWVRNGNLNNHKQGVHIMCDESGLFEHPNYQPATYHQADDRYGLDINNKDYGWVVILIAVLVLALFGALIEWRS